MRSSPDRWPAGPIDLDKGDDRSALMPGLLRQRRRRDPATPCQQATFAAAGRDFVWAAWSEPTLIKLVHVRASAWQRRPPTFATLPARYVSGASYHEGLEAHEP
jgi:hypothetical protein